MHKEIPRKARAKKYFGNKNEIAIRALIFSILYVVRLFQLVSRVFSVSIKNEGGDMKHHIKNLYPLF